MSCYISFLSQNFSFPEELAVVPWDKVRDGARALCRCNLQFDLGCMHSLHCAGLALSGRPIFPWKVLMFSFSTPLQQHLSGIRSLSLAIGLDLTQAYMLMTYAAFLFSHLYFASSDLFMGDDAGTKWKKGGGVFRKSCHPKIIYHSTENMCKKSFV